MPFRSFAFDDSITNVEQGGIHVPQGNYLLQIAGVRASAEDAQGATGYHWTLRIIGPDNDPNIGRSLQMFTAVASNDPSKDGKTQFGLGRLLHVCGINPAALVGKQFPAYQDFVNLGNALLANLTQKSPSKGRFGALVGDNVFNGRVNSQVVESYPEAEFQDRVRLAPPGSVQAQPANGPTGMPGAFPQGGTPTIIPGADMFADPAMAQQQAVPAATNGVAVQAQPQGQPDAFLDQLGSLFPNT